MAETQASKKPRLVVVIAVLFGHLVAIPTAFAMNLFDWAWWPVWSSQATLLGLYLCFGSGNLYLRAAAFLVGITYLVANASWFTWVPLPPELADAAEPLDWLRHAPTMLIPLMPSVALSVLAFVPLRAIFGSVQGEPVHAQGRFRTTDLFVNTFIAALAITWLKYAMALPGFSYNSRFLVSSSVVDLVCAISCLHFVLSRDYWLVGVRSWQLL